MKRASLLQLEEVDENKCLNVAQNFRKMKLISTEREFERDKIWAWQVGENSQNVLRASWGCSHGWD